MELNFKFNEDYFDGKLAHKIVFDFFKNKTKHIISERAVSLLEAGINTETERLKTTISAKSFSKHNKMRMFSVFGYGVESGEEIPGLKGKPSRKKPRSTDYAIYQERLNPILKEVQEYVIKAITYKPSRTPIL